MRTVLCLGFFFLVFIYLAVPGLNCGTQDLRSSLQYSGNLVAA